MKINAAQRHIDKAKALLTPPIARHVRRSECCPIALAVSELGESNVQVYASRVCSDRFSGYLPQDARIFIRDFDTHRSVQPFTFELLMTMEFQ